MNIREFNMDMKTNENMLKILDKRFVFLANAKSVIFGGIEPGALEQPENYVFFKNKYFVVASTAKDDSEEVEQYLTGISVNQSEQDSIDVAIPLCFLTQQAAEHFITNYLNEMERVALRKANSEYEQEAANIIKRYGYETSNIILDLENKLKHGDLNQEDIENSAKNMDDRLCHNFDMLLDYRKEYDGTVKRINTITFNVIHIPEYAIEKRLLVNYSEQYDYFKPEILVIMHDMLPIVDSNAIVSGDKSYQTMISEEALQDAINTVIQIIEDHPDC